jgi:hypothetical protein
MHYDGQRMETQPLCSVNRILNGLNIHSGIDVSAVHNAQALVTGVSASSWIPEYKFEMHEDYNPTFCQCNSRFLLSLAGSLKSNASGAACFVDVRYWKVFCYVYCSCRSPKSWCCHKHFESVTLYHYYCFYQTWREEMRLGNVHSKEYENIVNQLGVKVRLDWYA